MRFCIILVAAFLAAFSCCATAQVNKDTIAPTVDIEHCRYVTGFPTDTGGPDMNGRYKMPVYLAIHKDGDVVYGTMVYPIYESGNADSPSTATFSLWVRTISNGSLKGTKLTLPLENEDTFEIENVIKGRVKDDGDLVTAKFRAENGNRIKMDMFRTEDGDSLSGIYIGRVATETSSPAASADNGVIGIRIEGEKIHFTSLYFDESLGQRLFGNEGEADFDPKTGEFSGSTAKSQFTGTLKKGKLKFESVIQLDTVPAITVQLSGKLWLFGAKDRKPKLKKPIPASVGVGGEAVITIPFKNCPPGTLLAQDNPDVYIRTVRLNNKDFQVVLEIGVDATGEVEFTATTASGKTATTRLKIQTE